MYGIYVVGCVKSDSGLKIWTPRRSSTKATYPGMLDNTAAGGVGYPYGVHETFVKECYEEAGFVREYVEKRGKPVGSISYLYQLSETVVGTKARGEKLCPYNSEEHLVQPEIGYVYDLLMDEGDVPKPIDGESEDFQLLTIEEILTRLRNGEFKPNCGAVVVDFLVRHGVINSENERDYIKLTQRLHRVLPFPVKNN